MTIDPSFRMTVDDVFMIKDKGAVAVGRIESGVIHPGDTVEVHGQGPAQAVIVDRIEVKGSLLDEAGTGMNVGLALGGLQRDELHAGDLLTAGEGGAFAAPLAFDPNQAAKAPKRKKPLSRISDIIKPGPLIFLIVAIIIVIVSLRTMSLMGVVAVILMISAMLLLFTVSPIYKSVRGQRAMQRGSANTIATIVYKRSVVHEGSYSDSTTYHLTLEFTPTQALGAQNRLVLDAEIGRKFWEGLQIGQQVNICYATEDPKVLLIEGE